MATQTTHYSLTKPATSDLIDITVLNGNSDVIDSVMYGSVAGICDSFEASTTATSPHAIGDCFWLNNTLYKATAAITINDTITPGTNCDPTTVLDEIAASVLPNAVGVGF